MAFYENDYATLHLGDCLDILPTLADASVDAIVTDPPYGLAEHSADTITKWTGPDRAHIPDGRGFMRRTWDTFVPPPAMWDECLRVLKPGGHLVAFAGARTADLMSLSIRLAGFEIRDSIHWLHGSGWPKSLDVSKAIDKQAGAERPVIGTRHITSGVGSSTLYAQDSWSRAHRGPGELDITAPATVDAARWEGWGTALKPAYEPITLARKPLDGTVADNVLKHGVGGLHINGCRVGTVPGQSTEPQSAGRWPTNTVLSHLPLADERGQPIGDACADGCRPGCPVMELDRQSGVLTSGKMRAGVERANRGGWSGPTPVATNAETYGDTGGASRFFLVFRYEAKAPTSERPRLSDGTAHPTVKPLALMRWLVRLVTPPGGTILDPFTGTATTLAAALREGMTAIGIEQHEPYAQLAVQRLSEPYMVDLFADGGAE